MVHQWNPQKTVYKAYSTSEFVTQYSFLIPSLSSPSPSSPPRPRPPPATSSSPSTTSSSSTSPTCLHRRRTRWCTTTAWRGRWPCRRRRAPPSTPRPSTGPRPATTGGRESRKCYNTFIQYLDNLHVNLTGKRDNFYLRSHYHLSHFEAPSSMRSAPPASLPLVITSPPEGKKKNVCETIV